MSNISRGFALCMRAFVHSISTHSISHSISISNSISTHSISHSISISNSISTHSISHSISISVLGSRFSLRCRITLYGIKQRRLRRRLGFAGPLGSRLCLRPGAAGVRSAGRVDNGTLVQSMTVFRVVDPVLVAGPQPPGRGPPRRLRDVFVPAANFLSTLDGVTQPKSV